MLRKAGEQHNLKDLVSKNESVCNRVYASSCASGSDPCPNFAIYRTPFDVNAAISGMEPG